MGQFSPETVEDENGITVYTFAPDDDGPTCLYGDPFRVTVRDTDSKDLMIYLQGGGACWSQKCAANKTAGAGIQPIGWTNADPDFNPVFFDYDVVFVAYCDGSVFSGDNVVKKPDGSIERRHRGLANLSAALDIALERFPDPERIVLAGSSAGGYGTILGTAATRMAYPKTPLFVINDAGIGLTNPADPSIVEAATTEWKFTQFVPPSCEGCVESGQFTSFIGWGLEHDPSLRVSAFSSYQDGIIGGVFLNMDGPDFQSLLLSETDSIHQRFPERFERFVIDGGAHTAILAGYSGLSVNGENLMDWSRAMIEKTPEWRDQLQ